MNAQQRADQERVLREVQALVQAGNFVVLDTESTGVDPKAQIVSYAIIGSGGDN